MRYFTGYFLLASKFGGLTMKPWTFSFAAPVNQKDSSGCISICDSTGSFSLVSGLRLRQAGNRERCRQFGGTAMRHCGNISGAL